MKALLPKGWPRPKGYSNGILAEGSQVFVAGMIGWNEQGEVPDGFVDQFEQTLKNTLAVLAEANAGAADVVRMTWYVTDLDMYRSKLRELGWAYRNLMGTNFPAMSVVEVSGLVEPKAMIEIETTAVIGQ
ncbi:MAG: enamine deaminase RidA [Woeseia sp.]|nr:enamine deaminase RidA [Woeseia sp.]